MEQSVKCPLARFLAIGIYGERSTQLKRKKITVEKSKDEN